MIGYDVDRGGVFPGELDEFMILDGVLTADGLAALADYYGAGG